MPYDQYNVVDCDGHIVETVDELAKFMDPAGRKHALESARNRVGVEAFAYASDYPHEVDLLDGIREIEEVAERDDLNDSEKAAVLGGNAVRFFGL